MYKKIDEFSKQKVEELYPLYESGEQDDFDNKVEEIMIGFNNGIVSRRVNARSLSMANSLKALSNLDIDYADYLIERYMACDECKKLIGKELTCTF